MFVLYFVLICFVIIFCRRTDPYFNLSYNPIVIFLSINFLYTATGTFSVPDEVQYQGLVIEFLFIQIAGVVGMAASVLMLIPGSNRMRLRDAKNDDRLKSTRQPLRGNILLGLVFALLFIFVNTRFGGLYSIFSEGYSLILDNTGGVDSGVTLDDLIFVYIFPVILLSLGYAQYFNKIWMLASLFYVIVLVMLGSRNPILIYTGSAVILYSYRYKTRINYIYAIVFMLVAIPLFLVIAFVRNMGFLAFFNNIGMIYAIDIPSLIFKGGEFFTSMNVFLVHMANPDWWRGAPGESYLNSLLSVVPKFIWPSRPDAISNAFSDVFAPLGEGLGFSVNLEAYINFGIIGVFLVNLVISYFWLFIYFSANYFNRFSYSYLYSLALFVAFNVNRIDFQTVFKMCWLQYAFALILAFVFRNIMNIRMDGISRKKVIQ